MDREDPVSVALLPFRCGGTWLAVSAAAAVEVLPTRAVVPLPGAPSYVPGLVPLRGQALPLLDLELFLDLERPTVEETGFGRIVVLLVDGMRVGVPTRGVAGVLAAGEAVSGRSAATGRLATFAIAELETRFGLVTVLDLPALLQSARMRE